MTLNKGEKVIFMMIKFNFHNCGNVPQIISLIRFNIFEVIKAVGRHSKDICEFCVKAGTIKNRNGKDLRCGRD